MDILIWLVLGLLGVCIAGTFSLLVFVACYIATDIAKGVMGKDKNNVKYCDWVKESDFDDYRTGCGNEFFDATESGNPPTDWMAYCPYCGDKVKIK